MMPESNISDKKDNPQSATQRFKRCQDRFQRKKAMATATTTSDIPFIENSDKPIMHEDNNYGIEVQTDLTAGLIDAMESELQTLRAENIDLKKQLHTCNNSFDSKAFKGNNEKVLFSQDYSHGTYC